MFHLLKFKNALLALLMAVVGVGMVAVSTEADARRLGGGRPAGMQRQMPTRQPSVTPNNAVKPAGNTAAPAQTPVQPGKRSWMGPLAGIAAGLGIAALMSHFGMGEAFSQFMTMALLGIATVMAVSWLMRRFSSAKAGPQLAGAGAPYGNTADNTVRRDSAPMNPGMGGTLAPAGAAGPADLAAPAVADAALTALPPGFDLQGFERIAKMIFIRMQAANDAHNVEDLRKFTTPELFASLRLDLQDRGQATQQTDVMQLNAEVADTAQENGQLVVSVRFHGLIREEAQAGAQPFNELWHLVKPVGSNGPQDQQEWAIAGITPLDA